MDTKNKIKLNAQELRGSEPTGEQLAKIKRNPIYFILDEIYDTYNVGSLFRLADAIAIERMYLCGKMEYPPSSRIHKAAVGTENWVKWEKTDSTLETVRKLKRAGVWTVAIEQARNSVSYKNLKPKFPAAIIVGNESYGMDKKILEEADLVVELPMFGVNKSFNVWGSAAVVGYKLVESLI